MGTFDGELSSIRREISSREGQIQSLKKEIREMNELLEKTDKINSKVYETMDTLLGHIQKNGASICGNFTEYFRSQTEIIAKSKGIYSIGESTSSDKRQINQKILSSENKCARLQNEIQQLEEKMARYMAENSQTVEGQK